MSRFVFPYGVRLKEDGRTEVFPMAEVMMIGRGRKGIRALFHIDSGATTSLVPRDDAELLGLRPEGGARVLIRGVVGEALAGFRHMLTVQFADARYRIPVIFAESSTVPRVLGREGLFSRFGVVFDESKQRTAFLDAARERTRIDALFE